MTTGVRPGISCTSTVAPSIGRARSQPATRSTARAMCPAPAQPGSKATDTLGIRMKSHSAGTTSDVQTSVTCLRTAGASIGLTRRDRRAPAAVGRGV